MMRGTDSTQTTLTHPVTGADAAARETKQDDIPVTQLGEHTSDGAELVLASATASESKRKPPTVLDNIPTQRLVAGAGITTAQDTVSGHRPIEGAGLGLDPAAALECKRKPSTAPVRIPERPSIDELRHRQALDLADDAPEDTKLTAFDELDELEPLAQSPSYSSPVEASHLPDFSSLTAKQREEFYDLPHKAIQAKKLGWLTLQLGPNLLEHKRHYYQELHLRRISWNKIKFEHALFAKLKEIIEAPKQMFYNEASLNFYEQNILVLQREAVRSEERKESKASSAMSQERAASPAQLVSSRSQSPVNLESATARAQTDIHQFNKVQGAHNVTAIQENAILIYADHMKEYADYMENLKGHLKKEDVNKIEKDYRKLILTAEQATIFQKRLHDEIHAEKERLLAEATREAKEEVQELAKIRNRFLSVNDIEKRYQIPVLERYQADLNTLVNSILRNCHKHLEDRNLGKLSERLRLEKMHKPRQKQAKEVIAEQKKVEEDHAKGRAKAIANFEKKASEWLEKNWEDLPNHYVQGGKKEQKEQIKQIVQGIVNREHVANFNELRDEEGNTLFHHLLREYAWTLYRSKQKDNKDKTLQEAFEKEVKELLGMVELLYQHGFFPYFRNKIIGEKSKGLNACEEANRFLKEKVKSEKLQLEDKDVGESKRADLESDLLPDWSLNAIGLKYVPTVSQASRALKETLIRYCHKVQEDLNSKLARLFFDIAIKAIQRCNEVSRLTVELYDASFELSDDLLVKAIDDLMKNARRGALNRSFLYDELKKIRDEITKGGKFLVLPETYAEIVATQNKKIKEEAERKAQEEIQKERENSEKYKQEIEERSRKTILLAVEEANRKNDEKVAKMQEEIERRNADEARLKEKNEAEAKEREEKRAAEERRLREESEAKEKEREKQRAAEERRLKEEYEMKAKEEAAKERRLRKESEAKLQKIIEEQKRENVEIRTMFSQLQQQVFALSTQMASGNTFLGAPLLESKMQQPADTARIGGEAAQEISAGTLTSLPQNPQHSAHLGLAVGGASSAAIAGMFGGAGRVASSPGTIHESSITEAEKEHQDPVAKQQLGSA